MIIETAPLLLAGFVATSLSRSYSTSKKPEPVAIVQSYFAEQSDATYKSYSSAGLPEPNTALARADVGLGSMQPMLARLSRLARNNPTEVGVAAAEALQMALFLPAGLPPFTVSVTDSGAVILVFQENDHYAEIEFQGDGQYSLYCRDLTQAAGEGFDQVTVGDGTLCPESESMLLSHFAPHLLNWPLAA